MAKRPLKLRIRIPCYKTPRNTWRKAIHAAVLAQQKKSTVSYLASDKLEVEARIYLDGTPLKMHDVDNRVKDVLDALQGRCGGPKSRRALRPIIQNDNQIYRIIIEKAPAPKQSHGLGHLIVRRFSR